MNEITISEFLEQKAANTRAQWVDVRSASEFAAGHLPGAVNIPMEQIEARVDDLSPDVPIVLVCQSGIRARIVASFPGLRGRETTVLEGGTRAWIKAGQPIVVAIRTRWSLERQVRLGAGLLVLLGTALALIVDVRWLFLAGFVGLGLSFSGLTDFCPMGTLLAKMPWNRKRQCSSG